MSRIDEMVDEMWRACASEEIAIYGSSFPLSTVIRKDDLKALFHTDTTPRYGEYSYEDRGYEKLPPRGMVVSAERLETIPIHYKDARQITTIRRQVIKYLAQHAIADNMLDAFPPQLLAQYGLVIHYDGKKGIINAPDIVESIGPTTVSHVPRNDGTNGLEETMFNTAVSSLSDGWRWELNKHQGEGYNRPLAASDWTDRSGQGRRPEVEGGRCIFDKGQSSNDWNR